MPAVWAVWPVPSAASMTRMPRSPGVAVPVVLVGVVVPVLLVLRRHPARRSAAPVYAGGDTAAPSGRSRRQVGWAVGPIAPPTGAITSKRHRSPAEIIAHRVWLYHRFGVRPRVVEALLTERGVALTYGTVRLGCCEVGPAFAAGLRAPRTAASAAG